MQRDHSQPDLFGATHEAARWRFDVEAVLERLAA